jgi:hypothetical protein
MLYCLGVLVEEASEDVDGVAIGNELVDLEDRSWL